VTRRLVKVTGADCGVVPFAITLLMVFVPVTGTSGPFR
jgi:hypothetical protein